MFGIFKWLKPGTKMKRWLFVILLGILLLCYGIATIMSNSDLSIIKLIITIVISIIGFMTIIIGIIHSQKRVLELLVENTDDRIKGKGKEDVNVKSLIFNKKIYDEGPKIVVIGGGSGMNTVLKGLKQYTNNITAIVSMTEYEEGENETTSPLPLEDIRGSIVSLAENETEMEKLLRLRLPNGMNFTSILISAMQMLNGEGSKFIENLSKVLNITGRILPVTLNKMNICAELEDGTVIEDKHKIAPTSMEKISKISRVFISPTNVKPAYRVLEAIEDADAIVIGPGNLYTEVIPNLLIKGISRTIKDSKAIKIYIANIMTKPGETDDMTLSEHIKAIMEHANNKVIDYCVYDTGEIVPEFVRMYNKDGAFPVEQDIEKCKEQGIKTIPKDFACIEDGAIRHNSEEVADSIIEIICDDLKFKDMQNNPQYVKMNTKLKENNEAKKEKNKEKKKNKKQENKQNKKAKRLDTRPKSKFSTKYDERIKSIKESDITRKEKIRNIEKNK